MHPTHWLRTAAVSRAMGRQIPWAAIEPVYRAGERSITSIAEEFGVAESTITRKARREAWNRAAGNSAEIVAERGERPVLQLVSGARAPSAPASALEKIAARVGELDTGTQSDIVQIQRQDMRRARALVMALMQELEQQTEHIDLLRDLSEVMSDPDEKGRDKRSELLQKLISHANRTSTMKTLVDSLRLLVALEREAYGMDAKLKSGATLEDWLEVVDNDA